LFWGVANFFCNLVNNLFIAGPQNPPNPPPERETLLTPHNPPDEDGQVIKLTKEVKDKGAKICPDVALAFTKLNVDENNWGACLSDASLGSSYDA